MAAVKLVTAALPVSGSGRKPTALDSELVEALATTLAKTPTTKLEGRIRPATFGPESSYTTQGRAAAAGRRYADAVSEKMTANPEEPQTVRVNVYTANDENGKPTNKAPFFWRIYLPLVTANGNEPDETSQ